MGQSLQLLENYADQIQAEFGGNIPYPNSCGNCDVCCTVQGIQELGKPYFTECQHKKQGGGCNIYGSHPKSCRGYGCMWLIGDLGGPEERPDKTDILIGVTPYWDQLWVEIHEAKPNDMCKVLRAYRDRLIKVIQQSARTPWPYAGILYIPYGVKCGVEFPVQDPYEGKDLHMAGNTFKPLWGSNPTVRVHICSKVEWDAQHEDVVDLKRLLNGDCSWRQVQKFFKFGGFSDWKMFERAIRRHLLTEEQRTKLFDAKLTLDEILAPPIHEPIPVVDEIFTAWNAALGFSAFWY